MSYQREESRAGGRAKAASTNSNDRELKLRCRRSSHTCGRRVERIED